jgi:hypothetical protein
VEEYGKHPKGFEMEHSLWHLDGQWFVISTDRPQVSVVRFFGQATSNVTSILTFPELVEGKMTSLKSRVKPWFP